MPQPTHLNARKDAPEDSLGNGVSPDPRRRIGRTRVIIAFTLLAFAVSASLLLKDHLSTEALEALIAKYGYFLLFGIIILGNIGLPVPEETVVVVSGIVSRQGLLDYALVVPISIFSAILGDSLGYFIGRTGGRKLLIRHGRLLGVTDEKLSRLEEFFKSHGGLAVFIARFVGGLRFFGGPISGMARMRFGSFLFFNAAGAICWVLIMTQLGYHFGLPILNWVERVGTALPIGIGSAAILGYAIYQLSRRVRK